MLVYEHGSLGIVTDKSCAVSLFVKLAELQCSSKALVVICCIGAHVLVHIWVRRLCQRSQRGRQLGLVGSKQDTLICCAAAASVRRLLQQVFCGKFDCVYLSKGERKERGEKG